MNGFTFDFNTTFDLVSFVTTILLAIGLIELCFFNGSAVLELPSDNNTLIFSAIVSVSLSSIIEGLIEDTKRNFDHCIH